MVGDRWIRDDDKPPSQIEMLRRDIEELRDLEERIKSWVRWWVKQKLAGQRGRVKAKGGRARQQG